MSIHSQYVTGRKIVYLYIIHVYKDANIFSVYNLCSHLPFEEIAVSLSSAYSVEVLVVELASSMETAGVSLCTLVGSVLTPTPASVYSLATAVT